MKRLLLYLICSFSAVFYVSAQEEEAMVKRINEMLNYTREKNTEKILDYTYPKLFKIVTREQMADAVNGMYETDEFTIDLDSIYTIKVFPVFNVEGKEYCKIIHNMIMYMKFKEPTDTAGENSEADLLVGLMGEKYGKENVRFEAARNTLVIKATPDMIGIKENGTWYFANYNEDNPAFIDLLFSKAVQKKYKELN